MTDRQIPSIRPAWPGRGLKGIVLAAVLGIGFAACGEPAAPEAPLSLELATLLSSPERHSLHLGLSAEQDSLRWFSGVRAARLVPDGRGVVVLDRAAPYVRVFDLDGRPLAGFVGEGSGPGEATSPFGLAVSDSFVMLLSPPRVLVYRLNGEAVADQAVGRITPLDIAAGCGREWWLYGPDRRRDGPKQWIHSIDFDDGQLRLLASALELGEGRSSWHASPSLMTGSDGLLLRHRNRSGARELVYRACPDGPERGRLLDAARRRIPSLGRGSNRREDRDEGAAVLSLDPTDPRLAAAALLPEGLLVLETLLASTVARPTGMEDFEQRTRFYLVTEDSVFAATTPGNFKLLDARPGTGLVLTTSDPVPQVFVVPLDAVVAAVRAGSSGRRAAS